LYQLTGQSLREMLAVGVSEGGWLVGLSAVAALLFAAVIYALHRAKPAPGLSMPRVSVARVVFHTSLVLLAGTTLTAAARLSTPTFDLSIARKPTGRFFSAIVQSVSDVDGDGFGLLSKPPDPDPWDARVNPFALDVPGDGFDQNGLAGDLSASAPVYAEGPSTAPEWAWKPVFVLALLETFRADLIGARDGEREITPVLNALAHDGVSLDRAFSHNGFTIQSRYHIFTGSLAGMRGATSLVDDFKRNGYQTAFFSAQDETFGDWLDVGFARADVRYDARQDVDKRFSQFATPGSLGVPADVLRQRIREFLSTRDRSRPLFLTVNLQDTHFPYGHARVPRILNDVTVAKGDMREENAVAIRAMYLNTAAYVDRSLGEILGDVEQATGQRPVVVALGDHGESLFEHGFLGHGYDTTDEQTRIAFVARGFQARFTEPFGQADLRQAIWDGLALGPGRPTRTDDPAKRVTQYIGDFNRPHRLASVTEGQRLTFDLHTRKVRVDDRPWGEVAGLSTAEFATWADLVQLWERAMLARSRATPGPR
ncbi:MAG: sulfatase-like hydrolase/transferase, partial [Acidobacteria bacterium]|nr:sulfatase-like hydrolase/transferase [Acidobacteriota bacterium]